MGPCSPNPIVRVLRDAWVLFPGFLGLGVTNAVAVIVFARLLGPAGYGVLAVAQTSGLILAGAGGQWIRQSTLRFFPVLARERGEEILFWGISALLAVVVGILGLAATLVLLAMHVGGLAALSEMWTSELVAMVFGLGAVLVIFENINTYHLASLRAGLFTQVRLLGHIAGFAMAVVLVAGVNRSAETAILGLLAGLACGSVISARSVLGRFNEPFDGVWTKLRGGFRGVWRQYGRYGIPMGAWFLLMLLLNWSDRWIIVEMLGKGEAGIYSSVYSLTMLTAALVFTPVLNAIHPHTMAMWAGGRKVDLETLYSFVSRFYVQVSAVLVILAIAWGDPIVELLLGSGYALPSGLVPIILVGALSWQFAMVAHKGLEISESVGTMLRSVTLALLVNVALNLAFVPVLGLYAAAISTLVGFGTYAGLIGQPSRRILHWSLPSRSAVACLGVVLAVALGDLIGVSVAGRESWLTLTFRAFWGATGVLALVIWLRGIGELVRLEAVRAVWKSGLSAEPD